MPSSEFVRWQRYYAAEPFGSERDNWNIAVLSKMYADVHRGRGEPARKIKDFMWRSAEESRDDRTRSTLASLDAMAKRI